MLRALTDAITTRHLILGRRPATPLVAALEGPDWAQASPARIDRSLRHALALPTGGWFVLDAARAIGRRPRPFQVAGQRLVAWRDRGELLVAPERCPHMGASLACADVRGGELVCPWHGLSLGRAGHGAWRPFKAHDDGVLAWVRLDDGPTATDAPLLAPRPARFIDGVIRAEAACDPRDVIANRLDPWHGAHFHAHSFASLVVTRAEVDRLEMRVAYRVAGPVVVEVDASFHCPTARSIVMTIIDGDGVGSVVETHATPIAPGRTAVVEATLATSDRPGFAVARRLAPLLRPFVEARAQRLWDDDLSYAEQTYQLRAERDSEAAQTPVRPVRKPRPVRDAGAGPHG